VVKNNRAFHFCLLTFLVCGVFPAARSEAENRRGNFPPGGSFENSCAARAGLNDFSDVVKTPTDGGIRELVPDKYREKYERWKSEFLATEFGRQEWNRYAADKNFILTIKVSIEQGQGGGTGNYQWNEDGKLVGATITLGARIDKGYPNPIYFPVMNSLSISSPTETISENILAAAKLAHEFGHVNHTAKMDGELFRLQNKLIEEYNETLQASRFNMNAPRLVSLRKTLGGTPVEIWESREYWGEVNAMFYVLDRLEGSKFYCPVVSQIETNVKTFAASYEDLFDPVFKLSEVCRN
jgi:hypothetical protein